MTPETYNRLKNTSKEDFDRFVDWLFSHTLAEVMAARGDVQATRETWLRYFRRGIDADLLLDELMKHVPELFSRAQYADYDAPKVLAMLKGINLAEFDILPEVRDETSGFTGGCACGAVRYESTAKPVMMLHCHCRDCQRASGGPFSSFVVVPRKAFKLLQGSLRFHASPSERGGQTHRGFCPECGSPVQVNPDSAPHIVAIRTASLDDPSWFKPQVELWTSDAHPWDQMNSALPKFEKYPPSGD